MAMLGWLAVAHLAGRCFDRPGETHALDHDESSLAPVSCERRAIGIWPAGFGVIGGLPSEALPSAMPRFLAAAGRSQNGVPRYFALAALLQPFVDRADQ